MPTRKRTAPPPEPDEESLGAPVEDAKEEPPADDEAAAEPEPAKNDRQEAEQPCTECFRDGWPDDATSVGCSHDTWNRDL
jgi:hypothetical protein